MALGRLTPTGGFRRDDRPRDGTTKGATKARPCPVCGATAGCSSKTDGLLFCRKSSGPVPGFVYMGQSEGDDQYGLYRRADDPLLSENQRSNGGPPPANGHAPKSPPIDWPARARELSARLTRDDREALADVLGVPSSAWPDGLGVGRGDDADGPFWSFPEVDGDGNVIGVLRRYGDGAKRAMHRSGRGLIVPAGWDAEAADVLYVAEGPSDVIALGAVGLAAVGRPSNKTGASQLARLLSRLPEGRRPRVVVLGEYDANEKGEWPGLDGALKVSGELAAELGAGWEICWALPPKGHKDARAWVIAQGLDATLADAWHVAGDAFAETVGRQLRPPPDKSADPGKPAAEDRSYRFEAIDSCTFFTSDYKLEWLVQRLMVRSQPGVIGGPKKALKTSIAEDLVISLASATPFLGHFHVYRRCRVVMISGESGEAVLQSIGRRICAARDVDPTTLSVFWSFRLPSLANVLDRDALAAGLAELRADVVFIDPLYLCLLAGADARSFEAGNLFHMGPLLLGVARACLDAGCTPILCHHAGDQKIRTRGAEPMDLGDLAFAGIQEFARQWLLINPRKPFDPDTGSSKLWITVGGSAGQSGCWGVDVEEGVLAEDFTGRKWEVAVRSAADQRAEAAEAGEDAKQRAREQKARDDGSQLLLYLDKHAPGGEALGWTRTRDGLGWDSARMSRALQPLLDEGVVVEGVVQVQFGKTSRPVKAVRRKPSERA